MIIGFKPYSLVKDIYRLLSLDELIDKMMTNKYESSTGALCQKGFVIMFLQFLLTAINSNYKD